jgi:hypothetical protein
MAKSDPLKVVGGEQPASAVEPETIVQETATAKSGRLSSVVDDAVHQPIESNSIPKPGTSKLDKFRSTRGAAIANVATLQTALPVQKHCDAQDFVRLHPDRDNYWSTELCFVNVPIQGQKRDTLHMIEEERAMRFLDGKRILRFALALAAKPFDIFFLCVIPTQNLDNSWNATNIQACELSITHWTQSTSRKAEGVDAYKPDFSRDPDAFPEPKWPTQSLDDLITTAFAGRMIDYDDHPALLRLIGARQKP